MELTRAQFEHRGFSQSYLDSAPGARDCPVVMLLHGFPDTAAMWQAQIDTLHAAGYRCIAPDTLGCGESEIAPRVRDYNAVRIAGDRAALLDHLGIDKAHIVGHDWGAVVAWFFAAYHPQRTNKLLVMSVGHPTAYGRAGFKQKLLGWYTIFFQFGGLAESLLSGEGLFSLRKVFATHPDMDEVMQRLREPGRMTAALRIYRAGLLPILIHKQPRVSAPTLGIWSDGDRFLTEEQMLESEKYLDGSWRYERLSGHHWISLLQPERVSQLILEHFS